MAGGIIFSHDDQWDSRLLQAPSPSLTCVMSNTANRVFWTATSSVPAACVAEPMTIASIAPSVGKHKNRILGGKRHILYTGKENTESVHESCLTN